MMKIKNIYPVVLLAVALSASCEKVVEFDIEETTPKLVVMARGEADSLMSVSLKYSRFFLDAHDFAVVNNAVVSMECNGVQWPQAVYDDERYYFNQACHDGDTLTLHVKAPGTEEIVQGCRVPQRPDAKVVSWSVQSDPDNGDQVLLRLRLNDPAGQRNYYRLTVQNFNVSIDYNGTDTPDTSYYTSNVWLYCNDFAIIDQTNLTTMLNGDGGFEGTQLYFTDDKIDGNSHDISFRFDHYQYEDCDFNVVLETYPRDLYLYETTTSNSEDEIRILTEPTQIHFNIKKGGIGIFGVRSKTVSTVTVPGLQIGEK